MNTQPTYKMSAHSSYSAYRANDEDYSRYPYQRPDSDCRRSDSEEEARYPSSYKNDDGYRYSDRRSPEPRSPDRHSSDRRAEDVYPRSEPEKPSSPYQQGPAYQPYQPYQQGPAKLPGPTVKEPEIIVQLGLKKYRNSEYDIHDETYAKQMQLYELPEEFKVFTDGLLAEPRIRRDCLLNAIDDYKKTSFPRLSPAFDEAAHNCRPYQMCIIC